MNIKIGLRNIIKNYRRSLITIIAIAVGFMSLALFGGYIERIYGSLVDQAIIGERTAHLTVMKKGALENGRLNPGDYYILADVLEKMVSTIESVPEVKLVSPRINLSGLMSNGRVSTIFIAEGIDAEDMRILRGKYADQPGMLDPNNPIGAAISGDLAKILGLKEGDDSVLMVTTLDGQINALDVQISEIYNTGKAGTNDKFILLPLEYAQKLLDTTSAARVTVLLHDATTLSSVRDLIYEKLETAGIEVEIKSWVELSSYYKQVKGMFDMIFLFIFIIVIIIVVMSVINTMGMSVMERTREIGTLRSLGMSRTAIMQLFSVEGVLLSVLGCLFGLILTLVVIALFSMLDITYVPPSASAAVPLVIEFVPVEIVIIFGLMVILGLIAALIPAHKASKMSIVDALGHT